MQTERADPPTRPLCLDCADLVTQLAHVLIQSTDI